MFRKVLASAVLALTASSTAWAQAPRIEVGALFGYTLADGVSGQPVKAGDGKTYDRVDPKDSMNVGLSFGVFLVPSLQIGFLWRHQPTTIEVSGPTAVTALANSKIDGYHGYGAFYFGDPDGKARIYVMGGLGMTDYGGFTFQTSTGTRTVSGNARMSSTWGAGIKLYPSPKAGVQLGFQWTPTYIKSDATGWWCDPWFGCYIVGDAQYSNQFEFVGGLTFRF
jgi:hypothetical protein